jgi:hypothetical protein
MGRDWQLRGMANIGTATDLRSSWVASDFAGFARLAKNSARGF